MRQENRDGNIADLTYGDTLRLQFFSPSNTAMQVRSRARAHLRFHSMNCSTSTPG